MEYTKKIVKEKNLKLVGFNCSCVPRIIGDDITSILLKSKKELSVPFIFQGGVEKTPFELRVDMLIEYLNEVDRSKIQEEENTIILFGYRPGIYMARLYDVMKLNGIKIIGVFIPMIDIKLLPFLYQAKLFIFSDNIYFEEIFDYPFKSIEGKRHLSLAQPYGIENSIKWIKSIYDAFSIEEKHDENVEEMIKEYYKISKEVKEKGYKVGIVFIGLKDINDFFKMNYADNMDMIGFLEEMGFGIDYFIYDNEKNYVSTYNRMNWDKELIVGEIRKKMKGDNFRISFFSDEFEMTENIKDFGTDILYSDIYFDSRIIKMGISQFNIRDFNIGFQGALDTIKLLKRLCEMTYFKNFNKYF